MSRQELLQGGKVWEKAGVGVSVVYGTMPPEAYRAAKGNNHNSKPSSKGVGPLAVPIQSTTAVLPPSGFNPHLPDMGMS